MLRRVKDITGVWIVTHVDEIIATNTHSSLWILSQGWPLWCPGPALTWHVLPLTANTVRWWRRSSGVTAHKVNSAVGGREGPLGRCSGRSWMVG